VQPPASENDLSSLIDASIAAIVQHGMAAALRAHRLRGSTSAVDGPWSEAHFTRERPGDCHRDDLSEALDLIPGIAIQNTGQRREPKVHSTPWRWLNAADRDSLITAKLGYEMPRVNMR
jgi:hypothetical protein